MDSKLEARLEKIEKRLDAIWVATMKNSLESGDKLSNDCSITFKEEYKEFQLNKWYKGMREELVFITEKKGYAFCAYGFDLYGDWHNDTKEFEWNISLSGLASEEEVKEALIKESEERYGNIKLGMHFKGHWGEVIQTINTISDYYLIDKGSVFGVNGMALMIDGNWAEIIRYTVKKGETYYHNIYHNLKAVSIENTDKERFEAVVISEDKNCESEGFKIGKITECWLNEWTKVEN